MTDHAGISPELIAARANLDALANNLCPGFERMFAQLAVVAAENADRIGEEYDTRRLAGALVTALSDAAQRDDERDATIYGGMLFGVLAHLADTGDEVAAVGVNVSAQSLPIGMIRWGSEYARQLRESR